MVNAPAGSVITPNDRGGYDISLPSHEAATNRPITIVTPVNNGRLGTGTIYDTSNPNNPTPIGTQTTTYTTINYPQQNITAAQLRAEKLPISDYNSLVNTGVQKQEYFQVARTINPSETMTTQSGNRFMFEPQVAAQQALARQEENQLQRIAYLEEKYPTGSGALPLPVAKELAITQGSLFISGLGRGAIFAINPSAQFEAAGNLVTNPIESFTNMKTSFIRNPAGFAGELGGASALSSGIDLGLKPFAKSALSNVGSHIGISKTELIMGTAETFGKGGVNPLERKIFNPKLETLPEDVMPKTIYSTKYGDIEIIAKPTSEGIFPKLADIKSDKVISSDNLINDIQKAGTGSYKKVDFNKIDLSRKTESLDKPNPFLLDRSQSLAGNSPSLEMPNQNQLVTLETVQTPKTVLDLTSLSSLDTRSVISPRTVINPLSLLNSRTSATQINSMRISPQLNISPISLQKQFVKSDIFITPTTKTSIFPVSNTRTNILSAQRINTTQVQSLDLFQSSRVESLTKGLKLGRTLETSDMLYRYKKKKNEFKIGFKGTRFGYFPSIEAELFNVHAKSTNKSLAATGLVLRPILRGKRYA